MCSVYAVKLSSIQNIKKDKDTKKEKKKPLLQETLNYQS